MLPFELVGAHTFYLPIRQSMFPVSKYRLMCEHLLKKGIARPEDFVEPAPASDEDVLLVHTPFRAFNFPKILQRGLTRPRFRDKSRYGLLIGKNLASAPPRFFPLHHGL
jgi:acetoin utilization deacetylase AcuC-like enzyme